MKYIQQFKNSVAIIRQIRNDEWVFEVRGEGSVFAGECRSATRNGIELYVANGFWFTEIRDKPWELGLFGRLVWAFAARKKTRQTERKARLSKSTEVSDLTQ